MTSGTGAEAHLMRRSPRRGTEPDGTVSYTLEDLSSPEGEDPKAVVVVRRSAAAARILTAHVPPAHRGNGYGGRLWRQVVLALRAEGCENVQSPEPDDARARRVLVDLGFEAHSPGLWQLVL